ncbi:MAG TPA: DUF749 family protein [Methanomassiliicoccales archaeon]|nr:DUF749 family protein [Methanomassiliicoccales archaeon]
MFKARLVGVYTVGEMPEELRPFLNLEARRLKRELKMSDKFAALQVEGTMSYLTYFLDSLRSVGDLDKRLAEQDCELEPISRRSLDRVLSERK